MRSLFRRSVVRGSLVAMALGMTAGFASLGGCGEGPKATGAACDENTVCDGVCLLGMPGGMCTSICTVEACDPGNRCELIAGNNYCLPECTSDSKCRTGYSCVLGVCRPPVGVGDACEENEDCASQMCEAGVCSTTCTTQAECPDGLYCDETSGTCLADDCDSVTGVCLSPCADHLDCPDGQYCTVLQGGERRCKLVPVDPAPGTTGRSCAQSACASGYECRGLGDGDPDAYCTQTCTAEADCPPDMACRPDAGGNSVCIRRSFCEPCTFDGQCGFENEKCVSADPAVAAGDAYCSTACDPEDEHTCPLDSSCAEAQYCAETGTWVPDCSWCNGDCGPLGAPTYQCFHDYGACSGAGDLCAPCLYSDQCDQGLCLTGFSQSNRTCSEPCDSHNQCPDDYYCAQVTGAANQCIPRTGSCTAPSGGRETCEFCSDLIADCRRGFCLTQGGLHYCLDECGPGLPDCPAYQVCGSVTEYNVDFQVCIPGDASPIDVNGDCTTWRNCIAECPTGPDSCSANAPDYCTP